MLVQYLIAFALLQTQEVNLDDWVQLPPQCICDAQDGRARATFLLLPQPIRKEHH